MANKKVKTTSRINKQKQLEQKKRKRRKIMLIVFLLIVVITAICIYLTTSESFNIKEISIIGNNQLTTEQIYEIAELKIGDNICLTPEIVTKVKLKENGYIEDATIKKIYPNKLEIQIKERAKQFQIQAETGYYIYIDEQGYIIDCTTNRLELITITGMNITEEGIESKHRLEENDLDKMENILQISEELKKIQVAEKVTQIQVKDEYIINLNDGIIINLGNATNLKDRMYYVKAILSEEAGNRGTIFVNGNINEGFEPYFSAN